VPSTAAPSEPSFFRAWARVFAVAWSTMAALAIVAGAQSAWFFATIPPRVARANEALYDLMLEASQRDVYRSVAVAVETLRKSGVLAPADAARLGEAWRAFETRFPAAPETAAQELRSALASVADGGADAAAVAGLENDLSRLQALYADHYAPLVETLERPPLFLWPSALFLAESSGYRDAVTLNRAVYLAQVGEIGTARVLLSGLQASTDDPRMLGLTLFVLGRLQFEIFRARPEADTFLQSVEYLRQSLRAWPESEPAKRFLDYLLSLGREEAVPREFQGTPLMRSEGEGAAVSGRERRF
jgi:hypothetical protein